MRYSNEAERAYWDIYDDLKLNLSSMVHTQIVQCCKGSMTLTGQPLMLYLTRRSQLSLLEETRCSLLRFVIALNQLVDVMEEQKDVPEMFYFYNGIPLHKVLSPPGHVDKLSSIEFKKGDVMLVGYPKSGEFCNFMAGVMVHWYHKSGLT